MRKHCWKLRIDLKHAATTLSLIVSRSDSHFCSCHVRHAIRSAVVNVPRLGKGSECCFSEIKRKNRLNSVNHEIRQKPCRAMYSYALCPEYAVDNLIPLGVITFATFDDGLPDIAVSSLDYTISLRVIGRNANWVDAIFSCEIIYCKLKHWPVICDDFGDWSPSAEELFENKRG
jgi:hypothetical protein